MLRHEEEWQRTRDADRRQLSSMRVLASVLALSLAADGKDHKMGENFCPAVLTTLGGTFDSISANVFAFAQDMGARVEAREHAAGS